MGLGNKRYETDQGNSLYDESGAGDSGHLRATGVPVRALRGADDLVKTGGRGFIRKQWRPAIDCAILIFW